MGSWGPFIKDVRKGGGRGSSITDILAREVERDCGKGEGIPKPEKFADVLYDGSLKKIRTDK